MNEEMNSKKSNASIIYIIIIVLLLAVIGVLVFKQIDNKKEDTNNTDKAINENINSNNEGTDVYRRMIDKYGYVTTVGHGNLDVETRSEIVFKVLEPDKKVLCEEAFGKEEDAVALIFNCNINDKNGHDAYSAATVIAKYKELFEDSTELETIKASDSPSVSYYRYSSILDSFVDVIPSVTLGEDGIYRYDDGTKTAMTAGGNVYKIDSAIEHDDVIEVTIEVLSYWKRGNEYAYSTPLGLDTGILPIDNFSKEKLEELLYTGNLVLPKLKYTFRKPSNVIEGAPVDLEDYVLISVENL